MQELATCASKSASLQTSRVNLGMHSWCCFRWGREEGGGTGGQREDLAGHAAQLAVSLCPLRLATILAAGSVFQEFEPPAPRGHTQEFKQNAPVAKLQSLQTALHGIFRKQVESIRIHRRVRVGMTCNGRARSWAGGWLE